jgi:hypothetical protein
MVAWLFVLSNEAKMEKICLPKTGCWRIFVFSAILALTGLVCSPQLNAEIYQWVDENGVKHYSNSPPTKAENVKIMSGGYRYDEAADQERVKADQKTIDALDEEMKTEEKQVHAEKQKRLLEQESQKLEKARKSQPLLFAAECFSPSYSIQQGRGKFEAVVPRDLMASEYRNLQELFQSLDGKWEGNARVLDCEGTPDKVRKVIENYSVKSEGKMFRTVSKRQFNLETTLYSPEKRESYQENLRLYLDPKKLTTEPDISISDIELISISTDELVYVENRQDRSGSGALLVRETAVTIKKTGNASFLLERINYYNGMLVTLSTWHLEKK